MKIVLLGAPGAGKGTHCKRVADRYGVAHLSSGDILRRERAEGTELGRKAQSYMDAGALVPDDLIVEMMSGAVRRASGGYVLDGFPRTVNQAEALDKALAAQDGRIDTVINLEVDDRIVVERITGRRSCPQCGAVYHVKNMPPKVDGVCDKDGTALIQRPDDTEEVVRNRLETYYRQTEPVVNYYKTGQTVHDIDGNGDPNAVAETIFAILDPLAGKK
jgi:adenylate kinase